MITDQELLGSFYRGFDNPKNSDHDRMILNEAIDIFKDKYQQQIIGLNNILKRNPIRLSQEQIDSIIIQVEEYIKENDRNYRDAGTIIL